MELTFHGAAREVTGSCHVVRWNGKTILLDMGLFQGRRSEVREKNLALPVEPASVDALVLSHAHIDHAGRLPYLVRRGYRGPTFTTEATRDLCRVMLADSAHIQEKDAEFLARRNKEHQEPLYDRHDVEETIRGMRAVAYERPTEIVPGLRVRLLDAGHILGSASVVLEWEDGTTTRRLAFSGDIGRPGLAIIRDPVVPTDVDGVIMESTYGNRDHTSVEGARQRLAEVVTATAARGGKVFIPAFAVGRTQELIYTLHDLVRSGQIPKIPVIIDSPLATEATRVFTKHGEIFDRSEPFIRAFGTNPQGVLDNDLVHFTESVEASKEAMRQRGPMIVIAASGMVESGRILHHLLEGASDPRNTVLIVGFQAEHTLGRRIVERRPMIRVYGEEIPLRAQVEVLNGYSAHADRGGLVAWAKQIRATSPRLQHTWLVHGEPAAQDALVGTLGADGIVATCPSRGDQGSGMTDLPGVIETRRIYTGHVISVDEEDVRFPDSSTGTLAVVRHPGASAVVPILSDPQGDDPTLLLIRQFRHAAGDTLLKIPAGRLDAGEDPVRCAHRELREETGCTATTMTPLITMLTTPGFSDERIHLFMATGLTRGESSHEADEFIESVTMPMSEALQKIESGEIRDAKSVVGILFVAGFKLRA